MNNKEFSFLDMITILSLMLQIQNYKTDLVSMSNDDIMNELQKQDKIYLEKIIENQNKILERLAKLG